MGKLIQSSLCLLLIAILSSTSTFAKNDFISFENTTLATPPPTVYSPVTYWKNCSKPLTAIPSGGGTLNWYTLAVGGIASSSAPTPNTTTIGSSTTYYVSQTIAGVESIRVPIVVKVEADNGATILSLRCDASQIPTYSLSYTPPATINNSVLFDWANNPLISNTYNFSYSIQGGSVVVGTTGTSHWLVPNMLPGQSATLTLTSASHPCVPAQTITCSVPCGASTVTPTFGPIPTTYCINSVPPVLPMVSTNGITGTWGPLPVDTSTMGTKTYTFTPDPILFPCAKTTTLSISVKPIVPNFTDFSICSGKPAPTLSLISPNGITGTWNPSTVNTIASGSYVFTPNLGQSCAPTNKTITITVNPSNSILSLVWTVTNAFVENQIVTVTQPIGVNYLYQLDYGLFQESPIFENVASGTHSITVKDINGCSELTNDNVHVINYPKFFTPNGDTYNDTWNIFDLSSQSNVRVYIFDRYGKLLKDISPNDPGWDGTYTGQPMPATDYWFTVEYAEQGVVKKFKSHFSLKR